MENSFFFFFVLFSRRLDGTVKSLNAILIQTRRLSTLLESDGIYQGVVSASSVESDPSKHRPLLLLSISHRCSRWILAILLHMPSVIKMGLIIMLCSLLLIILPRQQPSYRAFQIQGYDFLPYPLRCNRMTHDCYDLHMKLRYR